MKNVIDNLIEISLNLYNALGNKSHFSQISKWNLIKDKSFCPAKETINQIKITLRMEDKATDRGLISKLHKQLI